MRALGGMRGVAVGTALVGILVAVAAWTLRPAQHAPKSAAPTPVTHRAPTVLPRTRPHAVTPHARAPRALAPRAARHTGPVRLTGQVPLAVSHGTAKLISAHAPQAQIGLSFGFPLRSKTRLDLLIQQEARTHHYLTREQLYSRFAPSQARVDALRAWLTSHGFRVTHIGLDRMAVTAYASTATIQKVLHVNINDYVRPGFQFKSVHVAPFRFYANTVAPALPARLGVQTISGLSDVDRFFTSYQLGTAGSSKAAGTRGTLGVDVRAGGYFPADLRALYDVSGHGYDGTGQTMGFTLWGAAERQAAMTAFAAGTGDTPITVDPPCVATGGSPTTPSSCVTTVVAGDHLLSILENGNTNNQFGANVETALDIEQAHGIATHAAEKYYLADCTATPPVGSGLTNGSNCNGSDVGMEEAIEDAANDPTLHSVSNSWAFGGEAEWGNADPFLIASENSLAIAAAAGTTFYFSTGDSGTYESGYPSDSQYVVGVGGTTVFSTTSPTVLSTENTWAAGGSWCSNIEPRPAWQTGTAVTANASCPGRSVPDISAIADTNSSVRFTSSTNTTGGTQSGGVGGTSVAAPELNGMEAVTENLIAAQTYAGPTPAIGFEAPVMYQMGNSGHFDNYYRDVYCGNTANPASGPDGDAAQPGWDAATGWGAPDWFNFSVGYAITLGATNLTVPPSLNHNYSWTCAKTPGNSAERGISCPTATTCYAVGAASGATPWYGKFLTAGSWGAVNTFYKSNDSGQTWVPSNSDMISIACSSSSRCVEVGDGGRIKTTSDSGGTWTDAASPFNKALTEVRCPSSTVCYSVGDRGTALKSTDGGATWSFLSSMDGNPIYGLACPSTSVCYATDIYAHVMKTADGGASWTMQTTPVTTPGLSVPGSGGPNPFAGLFGISCSSETTCVAVGGFPPAGTDPPIVTTTDGGSTWVKATSNSGTGNYLNAVACLPGTTTCWAAGRGGSIVSTTDLTTWVKATSGTTAALDGITCPSSAFCVASGQNGTVDVFNGTSWTPTTGLGGGVFLAGVTCLDTTTCYAAGKQGVTLTTTNGAVSWTQQAGGGTTQQMNAVSCASTSTCVAVGNTGTILFTQNGGQTWTAKTSGTTSALNGVSCPTATSCVAVGAAGTVRTSVDGSTWVTVASGTTNALTGVACADAADCVAVGAAGTILLTANGGTTWAPQTSGVTVGLNAIACPGSVCFATGALSGPSAVMLTSLDGGTTWATQASTSAQALTGIACVDELDCFAGGAIGTVVVTNDGGATWTQQGNPISGPTTALNAGPAGITAINAAACTTARCFMGMASSGNIMTTPLLTVTVHSTSPFGAEPNLTGLAANDPAISYSPSSEAAKVTGTLTCTTTATAGSPVGVYPVGTCSGLADVGFNVIYDYANSSHTVVQAAQSITFAPIAAVTYGDPDFDVSATASSGLAVTFTAAGNCTVTGTTVHITGAGSCTVTASQAGSDSYLAAPDVAQTFAIAKADQTITFGTVDNTTFGTADFEIDATSTSGLAVSFQVMSGPCSLTTSSSPSQVHISGAGTCMIAATQAGNDNYNAAAAVVRTFAIGKANQTISFAALPGKTFRDPDFTVVATATSGLAVTFAAAGNCTVTGTTVHITGAGSCTITASQTGNDNYNPAPDVPQTFAIAKANQTITFGALANKTFGDPDFAVSATASSGLAVSFAATGNCTLSGAIVHLANAGPCNITASQGGNGDYNAAPSVTRTFQIVNSSAGTVDGDNLRPLTGGIADLHVEADARGPAKLRGTLRYDPRGWWPWQWHGPSQRFQSSHITGLGIAADGHSAWITGIGDDGHTTFVAYVEDNRRKPRHTTDVFKLWIGGVLKTGSGGLKSGNVSIDLDHRGH
jgi:photosystem II stability/assembly factor-like uncharacterized protein